MLGRGQGQGRGQSDSIGEGGGENCNAVKLRWMRLLAVSSVEDK